MASATHLSLSPTELSIIINSLILSSSANDDNPSNNMGLVYKLQAAMTRNAGDISVSIQDNLSNPIDQPSGTEEDLAYPMDEDEGERDSPPDGELEAERLRGGSGRGRGGRGGGGGGGGAGGGGAGLPRPPCVRGGDLLRRTPANPAAQPQVNQWGFVINGHQGENVDLDQPGLYQIDQEDDDAAMDPNPPAPAPASSNVYPLSSNIPSAEPQPLGISGTEFISKVAAQADYCLPHAVASGGESQPQTPQHLLDIFISQDLLSSTLPVSQGVPAALGPLVNQTFICSKIVSSQAVIQLSYFINCMMLACMVNRYISEKHCSLKSVVAGILPFTSDKEMTIKHYIADGTACCFLAGSGSIYLLVLMASAEVRAKIRLWRTDVCGRLCKTIRFPSKSDPAGDLVINKIIPAIVFLRKVYPLKITMFFPVSFLHDYLGSSEVNCTDLNATDVIFDVIGLYNDFTKGRDWQVWSDCIPLVSGTRLTLDQLLSGDLSYAAYGLPSSSSYLPLTPARIRQLQYPSPSPSLQRSCSASPTSTRRSTPLPPTPLSLTSSLPIPDWNAPMFCPNLVTINTMFNPSFAFNTSVSYRHMTRDKRFNYTEQQRKKAKEAVPSYDLATFTSLLQDQLKDGKRKNHSKYVSLSSDILNNSPLRINNKNGGLLALVLPNMPQSIRSTLLSQLRILYPSLKHVDSEAEGVHHKFSSIHFSYYNRFSNRGDNAPPEADPSTLQKNGKKKVNTCQNVPRTSNELKDNPEQYLLLQDTFRPVFEWLNIQLKELLPETYTALSHFVDILPCSDVSPVYPFGGFVVNINVTTRIHRDWGDQDICLVINISDGEGGEICLFEPGIVFKFSTGDAIIFPSAKLSHFNLHYCGLRASLVLHSDRRGMDWVKDRNGWQNNNFMRSFRVVSSDEDNI